MVNPCVVGEADSGAADADGHLPHSIITRHGAFKN